VIFLYRSCQHVDIYLCFSFGTHRGPVPPLYIRFRHQSAPLIWLVSCYYWIPLPFKVPSPRDGSACSLLRLCLPCILLPPVWVSSLWSLSLPSGASTVRPILPPTTQPISPITPKTVRPARTNVALAVVKTQPARMLTVRPPILLSHPNRPLTLWIPVNSVEDFCIWAPPEPGPNSVVGNVEVGDRYIRN
jgi:hypothetical protein